MSGNEDWPDITAAYDEVAADYAGLFAAELAGRLAGRDRRVLLGHPPHPYPTERPTQRLYIWARNA